MSKKATHEHTRRYNSQLVLRTIYEHGQISRAQVARVTRLTRPTVSEVVADWMLQGMVEEVGLAPSGGGRRAILLSVVDNSRYLIGLDLGREDFRGALINLRGVVQHRVHSPLTDGDGDVALALVYDLVDALIQAADSPLLGIGIGTPGLVDAKNGIVHQAVNLNWHQIPLRQLLQERYNLPVYMANDCQAAAFGEYTFGSGESTSDLVVINVGWGVGAGIVHDGKLLHGNPYGAGEIGHITVAASGELCQCGRMGCLETMANTRAILRQVREAANSHSVLLPVPPEQLSFDTIQTLFDAGDAIICQVVQDLGYGLGTAITHLVGVLGGCRILIAGRVTGFGSCLLDAIRAEVKRRTLPALMENTEIGFVSLGADIVLRGVSALLLHHELALFG